MFFEIHDISSSRFFSLYFKRFSFVIDSLKSITPKFLHKLAVSMGIITTLGSFKGIDTLQKSIFLWMVRFEKLYRVAFKDTISMHFAFEIIFELIQHNTK